MTTTRTRSTPPTSADEQEVVANAVVETVAAQDILQRIAKGRWNIGYFASEVLGIDPHAGQEAMFDAAILRLSDGYTPAFLTQCVSAGNRAGKTLGLMVIVAHQTLYKMGLPPPIQGDDASAKVWSTAPYDWYHFGISQEVCELLHMELVRVLVGIHEAQKGRGCPLTEALGQDVAEWDKKERGEWAWFKWSHLLGGAEIHFRTTGEKALSTLGRDMNGWSWDEPAFDPNMRFIFDEVLNLRRMSTGGQAFLIATATEGSQEYEDLWQRGNELAPDREPDYISLRMSTRDNIGYGITQDRFDRMLRTIPPTLVPQNIDGYFIEARQTYFAKSSIEAAFTGDLPERVGWKPGRRYAMGLDPAITYDSTWSVVLDITDQGRWVGVSAQKRTGRQTAESIVGLAADQHHEYAQGGMCVSGVDATGFGGKVFKSLLQSAHVPMTPVEFGGRTAVKRRLLANTRTALDTGRLLLPRTGIWLQLRKQLLAYKLDDRRLDTDAVMALVIAVKMATRQMYGPTSALPFDYFTPPPSTHLQPPPSEGVDSAPVPPPVDDRVLRLGSLHTATVVRLRR